MPTTQRLDGEDKDNQRTTKLLIITTQEQKDLKKVLRNQFWKIVFALEITKERFLNCKKRAKGLCVSFEKEN